VSRSPSLAQGDSAPYETGWSAVSRLVREGWSWSGHERNVAFLNVSGEDGPPRFADVSAVSGLDGLEDGRALARVDWDHDGDLDLVESARTSPRLRVLRNDLAAGNGWLAVKLVGRAPNTGALGARVELALEGGPRARLCATRRAGEGFLAQSSAWLHFGLGAGRPRELTVTWPDGSVQSFAVARADRHLIVTQGEERAREWPAPSVPELASREPASELAERESDAEPPSATQRLVCATPLPVPSLLVRAPGRERRILGVAPSGPRGTGRALLIVLFSHTCAPCARELAGLSGERERLARAGLDVLALSVDPEEELEAVGRFLERAGSPGTAAFVDPESLAVLDALAAALRDDYRHLPVPASFLVDALGRLQVVYAGPVSADVVLADLALADLDPSERDLAALPFPGRRVTAYEPTAPAWLAAALERRGRQQAAREVSLAAIETRAVEEAELQIEFGKARVAQERFADAARHFERAIALEAGSAEAWKGLGYCRHRSGDLAGARAAYLEARALDPDDDRNRANLALLCADLGDRAAAEAELEHLSAKGSPYAEMVARRLR